MPPGSNSARTGVESKHHHQERGVDEHQAARHAERALHDRVHEPRDPGVGAEFRRREQDHDQQQSELTTEDHRRSIDVREVDYERMLRNRLLGDPATLEEIFDSLMSGHTDDLDPAARETLVEIIRDPAKLELFASELAKRVGANDAAHAESLLHLLRIATELVEDDEDAARDAALANLAKLLTGLNAETMADLLRRRGTPAAMVGDRDAVEAATQRMTRCPASTRGRQ